MRTGNDGSAIPVGTQVAVRTLTAAGFIVTDFRRLPTHGEFICERPDAFGLSIPYLIALWDAPRPSVEAVGEINRLARDEGRLFLSIAGSGDPCLTWQEFLDILGGPVPQWRALALEFPSILDATSRNLTPPRLTGEGWRLFEDATGDALEFVLGRRVQRLGKRLPGRRVSDLITRTPDDRIIVVDAKASSEPYDVTLAALRPLMEYVEDWRSRQKGRLEVNSALLVARAFSQPEGDLISTCNGFLSTTRVPLALLILQRIFSPSGSIRKQRQPLLPV